MNLPKATMPLPKSIDAAGPPKVSPEIQLFLSKGTMPAADQRALCVFMYENKTAHTPRGTQLAKAFDALLERFEYRQEALGKKEQSVLRGKVQGKMYWLGKKMERVGAVRRVGDGGNGKDGKGKNFGAEGKDELEFASWCEGWKAAGWDGGLERPVGWKGNFYGDEEDEDDEGNNDAEGEDWEYFDEPLPPGWIINEENYVVKGAEIFGPPILKPGDEGYYGPADGIAEEYRRAQKKRQASPEWALPTDECERLEKRARTFEYRETSVAVPPFPSLLRTSPTFDLN